LVWPAAHLFNFRFVPETQRVLYINLIALGYNAFLSTMATAKKSFVSLLLLLQQHHHHSSITTTHFCSWIFA